MNIFCMQKQILWGIVITTVLMSLVYFQYFNKIQIKGAAPIKLSFQNNSRHIDTRMTHQTSPSMHLSATIMSKYLNTTHLWANKGKFFGLFPRPSKIIQNFPKEMEKEAEVNQQEEKSLKKILFWNDMYGNKFFGLGFGREPFLIGGCQYDNCFTTALRDRFQPSEVDAVIWHLRSKDRSLPKKMYPNARLIFFTLESASYTYAKMKSYNNVFDTTFTYKGNSDIPHPYGVIVGRNATDEALAGKDFSGGRTRIAAWFVSHYSPVSGRQILVKTLMKYTEVDIYGKCGKLKCPKDTTDECFKMAAKKYFFYLSFENSMCEDYITEKFFNPMRYDIVPVVYGYGPYWKHAPPHSYINVFDFTSVEELAKYLVHLSQTPYEYNEYFRWKAQYFVLPSFSGEVFSICKLCEILNTQSSFNTSKYDLQNWFIQQSDCQTQKSLLISNFIKGKKLNVSYNQYRQGYR